MRILLVEDDKTFGNLLAKMLKREGFCVEWVERGDEAYQKVYNNGYDVVLLDWMIPAVSGIELCKKLRTENYFGKIILLTAKDSVEDKVSGLNCGADDYLTKPFEFQELIARINAVSRRTGQYIPQKFDYGCFVFDATEKTIYKGDVVAQLTPREFSLLELLLRNKDKVLPREVLLERIWGIDGNITNNNLDAHIKALRRKIIAVVGEDIITTVRGVGYKI